MVDFLALFNISLGINNTLFDLYAFLIFYICANYHDFIMKYVLILLTLMVGFSCGVKVPFTEDIKKEYSLENVENMKKVQFYTSTTIVLEKSIMRGGKPTTEDGTLVTSKNKIQDRIIIPLNTKCIFDTYDANGNVNIRFELGNGKTIKFGVREESNFRSLLFCCF